MSEDKHVSWVGQVDADTSGKLGATARGRFVAIEGADGSGKTTQARRLAEKMGALYITAPSGSEIGRTIRRVLSGEMPFPGADALQLLFLADRAEVSERVLKPALEAGRDIVADRWSLSGLVYGSVDASEAGKDAERWREWYAAADARTLQPDAYLVLAIDHDRTLARLATRGAPAERYDRTERVRAVCASYASLHGSRYLDTPILCLEGARSLDEVAASVAEVYRARLVKLAGEQSGS